MNLDLTIKNYKLKIIGYVCETLGIIFQILELSRKIDVNGGEMGVFPTDVQWFMNFG